MLTQFRIVGLLLLSACTAEAADQHQPARVYGTQVSSEGAGQYHAAVQLSPGGDYIAALARLAENPDVNNLVTMRSDASQQKAVTAYSDINIAWFFWASDDRLVFGTEKDGAYHGSYTIGHDGKRGRKLALAASTSRPHNTGSVKLVDRLPTQREKVLVSSGVGEGSNLYTLDLRRGSFKSIGATDFQVEQWFADHTGAVRAAVAYIDKEKTDHRRLFFRSHPDAQWGKALDFDAADFQVLDFHADNRQLIVASRMNRSRHALMVFDPALGKSTQMLIDDPDFDVWQPGDESIQLLQSANGHLISYHYLASTPNTVYFDARWEFRQRTIDEALADTGNRIIGHSVDERKLLVLSQSPSISGDYYLYSDAERRLQFLFSAELLEQFSNSP